MRTAELILPVAKVVQTYAESLLKGIEPGIAARKPVVSGTTIEINHPTFNYGHLSLYAGRAIALLGGDKNLAEVPENWEPLFKNGAPCQDDPSGTIYPAFPLVREHFLKGYGAALQFLSQVDNSAFEKPTTEERLVSRFPTVGTFAIHLLTSHINMHMGQISGWRRCMGLGAA
jgi:hypothetical protein